MKTCPKCGEVVEKLMGKWWCENCVEEVKPKTKKLQWLGTTTCDFCGAENQPSIVDGRTKNGQWAVMCLPCWKTNGVGKGVGRGSNLPSPAKWRVCSKITEIAGETNGLLL